MKIDWPFVKRYLAANWQFAAVIILILLLFDRRRMLADIRRRDARIDKIVDDYHSGNITISESLNSLKMVLFEMRHRNAHP